MPALSAAVLCLVVGVLDGDTVKLRCGQDAEEKVRLLQIDAPERKQAFGNKAKQALSDLAFQREVQLERGGTDRYGRTLGRLVLDGTDLNFEMVRLGFAWCYRRYLTDAACLPLEENARSHRRGLWVDTEPVAPWAFRASSRGDPPTTTP